MASLSSSPLVSNPQWRTNSRSCRFCTSHYFLRTPSSVFLSSRRCQGLSRPIITSQLCTQELVTIDRSALVVAEAFSEEQLWAAACLRVRSFNEFQESYGVQDHKRYLAEREFEALKERIAGKRIGFRRVSCINATLPLSETSNFSDDLCSACKFSEKGENRIVVGTLDLNQCLRLPEEITGKKPEGIGADLTRAYLSNVCVAKELHRNGVGYAVVAKAKELSQEWGITDLYVHVAIDNEPARKLYIKSGFVYENDEPAWQARFLDRPRRILLWTAIP
ncbi:PREDICTED: uncharacterized protein LOC104603058 isoform X1 [Nelumbo nucifera]|uniref:Uncharacterized protein LOC104603058 isoform X1 n=1 Tax=Nelumbo nucifera TaxID=4432 RepID=A0A1U8AQQ5_NELNU|nr:PREDICTED: uncharacterized protein LOC104603058 isoform X1 [Nelumbo nucifera]